MSNPKKPANPKAETKAPKKTAPPRARTHATVKLVPVPGMTNPSKEIMDALAAKYTPEGLIAELDEMARAVVTYTNSKGVVNSKPDYPTRFRALELRFAYLIGRPVERQEIIKHSPPASIDSLMADAKRSPVFRATLIDLLQNLTKDEEAKTKSGE